MTYHSMFHNGTIEDMNQHLLALTAGSHHALLPRVEFSPARLRMKIMVDEAKAPGQTTKTSVRDYWLPGQRVTGKVLIESKNPITLAHARITLDGVSRMHTRKVDLTGTVATIPTLFAYKFLSQSQDLILEIMPVDLSSGAGGFFATMPFDFTISRVVLSHAPHVPAQCLKLPPTLCVGPALRDDVGGKIYAQPNISYQLIAQAQICTADEEPVIITATQEIPIWVSGEANPPLDIGNFPGEFITTQTFPCRLGRLRSKQYSMTLSTGEPPAVTFGGRESPGLLRSHLSIKIEESDPAVDCGQLMAMFHKAQVKIVFGLRAKTFYSMRAFPKVPDQSMLTVNGPHKIHDRVMALPPVKQVIRLWTMQTIDLSSLRDDSDGNTSGASPQTLGPRQSENVRPSAVLVANIPVATRVPMNLPPSFCSAVVSRQYSLILKGEISGVRVKDFVLEVPLQVVYNVEKDQSTHRSDVFESLLSDDDSSVQDASPRAYHNILPSYAR